MKPNLVCRITVRTASRGKRRVSGYPITPDRIITVAHDVADAAPVGESDARDITLAFGAQAVPIEAPVYMEWCDIDVDVAVLRCQLPAELQPAHRLLTMPPHAPVEWFAQGYTDFGKRKRRGGQDDYNGTLTKFADDAPMVALTCTTGLITSQQWAGGSGSVAFDSERPQIALAVITDYQGGKKLDQLMAVPICYLLNAASTRDGFRRAIQFDAYERQDDYRNRVIGEIASKLAGLGGKLESVAKAISELAISGTSGINLNAKDSVLAEETARFVVDRCAVTDVVSCFLGLMQDMDEKGANQAASIIDHLLPLNYAPALIQQLREQLADGLFGLVENQVETRTLAEIIMAGYDQQPAKFAVLTDGRTGLRGQTAIEYPAGPEEGPRTREAEMAGLWAEVSNLLGDMVAFLDATPLQEEIKNCATRLQARLRAISKAHQRRTVYCVLALPPEGTPERDYRKQILTIVRHHVPELFFMELMSNRVDEREIEVDTYIRLRFMRTQTVYSV